MHPRVGPSAEELRTALHEAADWVASYLQNVGDKPVLAQVSPGEIAARLPQAPPEQGESLTEDYPETPTPPGGALSIP